MSLDIISRYTSTILFSSPTAPDLAAAIKDAVKNGANLYGANLHGADLCGANLYGADLRGTNLCEADLCGANLYGADLYGADLCEANLYGANLCEANLYGAKGLLPNSIRPLQILGTREPLIVRAAGYITVGCEHHAIDWWENNAARAGRLRSYTEAEITEYVAHITYAKQWMEAKGVAVVVKEEAA